MNDFVIPNFSNGAPIKSSFELCDDAEGCECCESAKGGEVGKLDSEPGRTGEGPQLIWSMEEFDDPYAFDFVRRCEGESRLESGVCSRGQTGAEGWRCSEAADCGLRSEGREAESGGRAS